MKARIRDSLAGMTKDDDSHTFTITDPGGASRGWRAVSVHDAFAGLTAFRAIFADGDARRFIVSGVRTGHGGKRTLGGWRRKVMLPDVALDVLMGGEQTAEQVKATLTPETVIALGTLVAARLSRPHLPESIREQATFRGFA